MIKNIIIKNTMAAIERITLDAYVANPFDAPFWNEYVYDLTPKQARDFLKKTLTKMIEYIDIDLIRLEQHPIDYGDEIKCVRKTKKRLIKLVDKLMHSFHIENVGA